MTKTEAARKLATEVDLNISKWTCTDAYDARGKKRIQEALDAYESATPGSDEITRRRKEGEDLFGFAPFRKWFDSVWPKPNGTRNQVSNWKYKENIAWAAWAACEKIQEGIIANLEISLFHKEQHEPKEVSANELITRMCMRDESDLNSDTIDYATRTLRQLEAERAKRAEGA